MYYLPNFPFKNGPFHMVWFPSKYSENTFIEVIDPFFQPFLGFFLHLQNPVSLHSFPCFCSFLFQFLVLGLIDKSVLKLLIHYSFQRFCYGWGVEKFRVVDLLHFLLIIFWSTRLWNIFLFLQIFLILRSLCLFHVRLISFIQLIL